MGKFKFWLVSIFMLMLALPIMAQDVGSEGDVSINVGTFTGIVALISMVATQVAKIVPAVANSKGLKIVISAVLGILICMVLWVLEVETPMAGMEWWQSLIYGLAAGLSGCGLYDLIKAIVGIISPKKEE